MRHSTSVIAILLTLCGGLAQGSGKMLLVDSGRNQTFFSTIFPATCCPEDNTADSGKGSCCSSKKAHLISPLADANPHPGNTPCAHENGCPVCPNCPECCLTTATAVAISITPTPPFILDELAGCLPVQDDHLISRQDEPLLPPPRGPLVG